MTYKTSEKRFDNSKVRICEGRTDYRNIDELRLWRFVNIGNAYFRLITIVSITYEENEVEEAEKILGALRYETHFR